MRATIPSFIPPHESFTLKESALPLPHLLLTPVLLTHHHQPEALIFLTSFSLLLFLILLPLLILTKLVPPRPPLLKMNCVRMPSLLVNAFWASFCEYD